jgi:uncharacterized membrane protein
VKLHSRDLALTAVFAALYAVGVLVFASISFELVQVRVADALIPMSMLFGWPVALGVTIGCAIANFASPLQIPLVEITLGSLANLVASMLAWRISKWQAMPKSMSQLLGCLAATLAVTIIVGTYLALFVGLGVALWVWWLTIGVGSLISIGILGYILVQIMSRIQPISDAT